jgi:Fungal specific transcription factor domain
MTNFLTHPSLETIQALLIISTVLTYNMNPGVAYILIGMAVRMAFSLGLQIESHQFTPAEQYRRRYVWWLLAWQDSHFSISYDRPSATTLCGSELPYRPNSAPGHRNYPESMCRIIKLTQSLIRGRILEPSVVMTTSQILAGKDEVARIVGDGEPHLRDRKHCFTQNQHLERLALKLHASYITSELCRPALKSGTSSSSRSSRGFSPPSGITARLHQECITNLQRVIKAYLELNSICYLAARSWIGTQRTVSAAFLLAVQEDSLRDPKVHTLLRDLEAVVSQRTLTERGFFDLKDLQSPTLGEKTAVVTQSQDTIGTRQNPADTPHWARSMTKSLKALSKLNAVLESPANGEPSAYPNQYEQSNPLPSIDYAGRISRVRNSSSNAGGSLDPTVNSEFSPPGMAQPITPENTSTSSAEWNFGNMVERAGEFVQPALWE